MITFKEIKAHFQTLCKRFKHQAVLILKYFICHPFKLLLAIVALLVMILAVYAIEYFIAGQSFRQENMTQTAHLTTEPADNVSVKIKKFAKNIKLHHATPEVKHQEPSDQKKAEVAVRAEVIEPADEPVKYRVWEIKQPLAHLEKNENVEPETAKEEKLTDDAQKTNEVLIVMTEDTETEKVEEPVQNAVEEVRGEVNEIEKVREEVQNIREEPAAIVEDSNEEQPLLYRKVSNLGLTYLDDPTLIEGDAVIYGANELYVGQTYLYLYGIYTDPIKYEVRDVTNYLHHLTAEKKIQCLIVAYTKEGVATGLCFADDVNINQTLVDLHMADNVAL